MSRTYFVIGVLGATIAISGCTTARYLDETNAVDTTGAFQLIDRESFEPIDLAKLLVSYADSSVPYTTCPRPSETQCLANTDCRQIENLALQYFNCAVPGTARDAAVRNALQERMLAASTQRCNAFKTNLQRSYSRTNFGLGVLGTAAGTLGALVTNPVAAGNWSAASAIFSGTRAEYNQDYLANLAVHTIAEGIDLRRQRMYASIQQDGQSKTYSSYPVEAAIKDALAYHGECSVIAGFEEASKSITEIKDPGLSAALPVIARVMIARDITDANSPDERIKIVEKLASFDRNLYPIAGSLLQESKQDPLAKALSTTRSGINSCLAGYGAMFDRLAKAGDSLETKDKAALQSEINKLRTKVDTNLKNWNIGACETSATSLAKEIADISIKQAAAQNDNDRASLKRKEDLKAKEAALFTESLKTVEASCTTALKAAQTAAGTVADASTLDEKKKALASISDKPFNDNVVVALNKVCPAPSVATSASPPAR